MDGTPELKNAIIAKFRRDNGLDYTPEQILVSCGGKQSFYNLAQAIIDPGDEVIVMAPFFVEYHFYVDNHGGVARVVNCDDKFQPDLEALRAAINERTRALIINSPNNPSGQVYDQATLDALGAVLDEEGQRRGNAIVLIMDEPYRSILFDGHQAASTLQASRNAIVLSSWSKELSLAGERIGYLAVNPEIDERGALLEALTLANRILGFVNAPALMQRVVARLREFYEAGGKSCVLDTLSLGPRESAWRAGMSAMLGVRDGLDGVRDRFMRGPTAMQELIEPMVTGAPYPIKGLFIYGFYNVIICSKFVRLRSMFISCPRG